MRKLIIFFLALAFFTNYGCGGGGDDIFSSTPQNPVNQNPANQNPQTGSLIIAASITDQFGQPLNTPVNLYEYPSFNIDFRIKSTSSSHVRLRVLNDLIGLNCGSMLSGFSGCLDRSTFYCDVMTSSGMDMLVCEGGSGGFPGAVNITALDDFNLQLIANDFSNPLAPVEERVTFRLLNIAPGNGSDPTDPPQSPPNNDGDPTSEPPVANAGTNQTVIAGSLVVLDGNGSNSGSIENLSFNWMLVSKPVGSNAALSYSNTINPSFIPDLPGIYTIHLIVYEGAVASDISTITVTVHAENTVPSILAIDGGNFHSLLLMNDGSVWSWGNASFGGLGDGSTSNRILPQKIGIESAVSISSGNYQSFAVLEDGTAWGWGSNSNGQLGDGTTIDRSFPVRVLGLQNVIQVSGGSGSSAALLEDGTVWRWGYNSAGNILIPEKVQGINDVKAISIAVSHTVALKTDGSVWQWHDTATPNPFLLLNDSTEVATGSGTTFALKSDGTVWAHGYNYNGELGDGTTENRNVAVQVAGLTDIVKISAGVWHTLALKADGTVWAWGEDTSALGHGSTEPTLVPVQVVGLDDIRYISAGHRTNHAISHDGTVWAWGWNRAGKLGDGTTNYIPIPTIINIP